MEGILQDPPHATVGRWWGQASAASTAFATTWRGTEGADATDVVDAAAAVVIIIARGHTGTGMGAAVVVA